MSTRSDPKQDLRGLTLKDLREITASLAVPAHRAQQIFSWVAGKGVVDVEGMRNVPKTLLEELRKKFYIGRLLCEEKAVSKDLTEKYLWKLEDGAYIESVFLRDRTRRTLCVSTQVGCKFGCPFCSSGADGFKRNLRVGEIVGQLLEVQAMTGERITNLVFMGMGEPLDNYGNLVKAIAIINHPDGIGLGARKITISTCGLVPEILKLKDLGLQLELSISLHAANDALRNKLVPVNRKYPLKVLLDACAQYFSATGRVITLEYTVIKGENDSARDASALAGIAKRLKAKINLIGCSASQEHKCDSPGKERIYSFEESLREMGAKATIRRSKGSDIMAACGQLAAKKQVKGERTASSS